MKKGKGEKRKGEETKRGGGDVNEFSLFPDVAAIRRTDARLQSYIRKENIAEKLAGNEGISNKNEIAKGSKPRGLISDETLLDRPSM